MMTFRSSCSFAAFLALFGIPALAGESDVIGAKIQETASGVYRFDVTVRHADTGWDHYADRFEIVGADGEVLASRVLLHPHVDEQPFTRSLIGVAVPGGVEAVTIRAHDSIHGYGGKEMKVSIPR